MQETARHSIPAVAPLALFPPHTSMFTVRVLFFFRLFFYFLQVFFPRECSCRTTTAMTANDKRQVHIFYIFSPTIRLVVSSGEAADRNDDGWGLGIGGCGKRGTKTACETVRNRYRIHMFRQLLAPNNVRCRQSKILPTYKSFPS